MFWQREIIFDQYGQLGFFLVIAALIEEGFKYLSIVSVLKKKINLRGLNLCFGSFALGLFFGVAEISLVLISSDNLAGGGTLAPEIIFSLVSIRSILVQHTI